MARKKVRAKEESFTQLSSYQGRYKNYIKVKCAPPFQVLGDVAYNLEKMYAHIQEAYQEGVELLVFPSLTFTGNASPAYLLQKELFRETEKALLDLVQYSYGFNGMSIVFGSYVLEGQSIKERVYLLETGDLQEAEEDDAHVAHLNLTLKHRDGDLRALLPVDVSALPTLDLLKSYTPQKRVALFIHLSSEPYTLNTSLQLSQNQQKQSIYQSLSLSHQMSVISLSPYVRESSAECLYGSEEIIVEKGIVLRNYSPLQLKTEEQEGQSIFLSFDEEEFPCISHPGHWNLPSHKEFTRAFSKTPFLSQDVYGISPRPVLEEAKQGLHMLAEALAMRVKAAYAKKMLLGLSGGLDSTLALVVAVRACRILNVDPKEMILCLTMPGFGTSKKTYDQAYGLAKVYGVDFQEISIVPAVEQHFKDIGHSIEVHDVTYENAQARERTQILMDLANKHQGIVLGTGDMSEIALGFATYNGDHMSMYNVNATVPKTMIPYFLAVEQAESKAQGNNERAEWLQAVIDTPISPELLPNQENQSFVQKTEDILGPYALHDFFLYHFLNSKDSLETLYFKAEQSFVKTGIYSDKTVFHTLQTFIRRFITQQFKRSCTAEGIGLYSFSLSPRAKNGYALPADTPFSFYKKQLEKLEEQLGLKK